MSLIGDLLRKGGNKLGISQGLSKVTDDPRVNLQESEVERIEEDKLYYQDDLPPYRMKNSYGYWIKRKVRGVNVTKMASRRLASLIFNEGCSVKVDDDDAQKFLDSVFKYSNFYLNYEKHLEEWIALGSGCARPYVDANNNIDISWATADQVFPLKINTDDVQEICIAFKTQRVEHHIVIYYTLLEFHQFINGQYTITNELYRSTDKDQVGVNVPLDTLDDYADLSEKTVFSENVTKPLFAFYTNPGANNICMGSPMGLGLIDNAKSIVDAINRTHTQFIWEVKQGQRRIIVPEQFLGRENIKGESLGPVQQNPSQAVVNGYAGNFGNAGFHLRSPMYDPDITVFSVGYGMDQNNQTIKDVTSDIRVDEYQNAMAMFLHEFENAVGLSQGTFTTTPSGIQTATEVVTNNSMTYQTRSSYLTEVEKNIKALVIAILNVARSPELFSDGKARWSGDPTQLDIKVDFNDGVFIDQDAQRTADLAAVTAQIMPKVQFLMRNYDLDQDQAEQWLAEVKNENPVNPVPDQEADAFGYGSDDSDSGGGDDEETDTGEDSESS